MKFVCYTDWNQLPESANALFLQAEKDSLFFSRPWFENVATALNDDETMALACVVAGSKVMAILPLMKSAGNIGYALKHRYTPLYSLLLAKDDQQQVLACLVEGLHQLPLEALLLEPVADKDGHLEGLQGSMQAAGFGCDRLFRFYNWFLRVQGQSYAEYMAARPAKLRNTISRKKRKLEREHGYDIHLFSGDDVPHKMPDYYAVYSASWKANEQYAGFVDTMVARFSKAGWSRLAILYIKEQPVAAQLWFVGHGKASIFRLAYDKAWKPYSPGSILTSFLMEYVIDTDKVEEIDFLTGNDAYKQDWMSDRRERFALSCVKSVKPAGWYERFVASLKRILKKQ
ncbi:GNAT family N-acetyltransferase [Sulfuriflexus mobilis]|uniref:GNAT family N-acetyltransferase n=1 Tax=Sulfuriflexus mobilis TaxID=1811807 RepID=UPI000F81C082|nr:GNAT family N-acetyltransferase [Sulfuriflexus mobilis]